MARHQPEQLIPQKARRILNGLLIVFLMLSVRLWYLSVLSHDAKKVEAERPQRRVVIEKPDRATISDRFGLPIATNRVCYQAAVRYSHIRRIPRISWSKEGGRKVKHYKRKEYVEKLSQLLGEMLQLDAERIEDLIYSKAAILGSGTYVLKENISEKTYFRLKMLEKDWPGIHADISARRCYPNGSVLGEIVGYIGPISRFEYDNAMEQIKLLKLQEEEEGIDLSHEIEKKSFAINDLTGKVGVEATFDAQLRGLPGKKVYLADIRGRALRHLDESEPACPGEQLQLSVSIELQRYAEQLLTVYNSAPPSERAASIARQKLIPENRPWMKGGAIVVLDAKNGEVLTLASYPRYNPNDFIRTQDADFERVRNQRVKRWFETESYLEEIWNLKMPLERERFDVSLGSYYEEKLEMGWDEYLGFILPKNSPVRQTIEEKHLIEDATEVQRAIDTLLLLFEAQDVVMTPAKIFDAIYSEEDVPTGVMVTLQESALMQQRILFFQEEIDLIKKRLAPYFVSIPINEEKLLLVDLYRLAVDPNRFDPMFENLFAKQSLSEFHEISGRLSVVSSYIKDIVRDAYHDYEFKGWREKKFKRYLNQKRKEERLAKKKYARPYLEFLDEKEKQMFTLFWEKNHLELLSNFLAGNSSSYYGDLLLGWKNELDAGAHLALAWRGDYCRLQELISQIDSSILKPYFKTFRSFSELSRPLYGNYPGLRSDGGVRLEKHLASGFYPLYGYGYARSYAYRQATTIGSLFKLVPAYEALRQNYFASTNPSQLVIIDDKYRLPKKGWFVGKTSEGKPIPLYYKGGRLPRSDHAGIGRVDLTRALETSSNPYFALLAGDVCEDPEDLCSASALFGFGEKTGIDLPGEFSGKIPTDVSYNRTGLYSMAIGQHSLLATPLQGAVMLSTIVNGGSVVKPQITLSSEDIKWQLFMPKEIQKPLIDGMRAVMMGEKGTGRFIRSQFPPALIARTIGKTSTAEVIERYGLDVTSRALKSKEIWFGSVIYDEKDQPEIVVVIFLRDGEFGRHAVPLALKMGEKWHEICVKKASKRIEETSHGKFTSS